MNDEDRDRLKQDGFEFQNFTIFDLIRRRNEIGAAIREAKIDANSITVAACALIFIEGCRNNPEMIARNMMLLMGAYENMTKITTIQDMSAPDPKKETVN